MTYQVVRRTENISFKDYLATFQKDIPFVMGKSYTTEEQAYVNQIGFKIPTDVQRRDLPYAMLYSDMSGNGDGVTFSVGGITITWEECRLAPLTTVLRTPGKTGPINSPDDIWKFYTSKRQADIDAYGAAADEAFLLTARSFTPVVNGAYELSECVSAKSLKCWVDAGLTTTGEALSLLVAVRPLAKLAEVGLDAQKIVKISQLSKRGLQAVATARFVEGAAAAARQEWMEAVGYLADGVLTLASTADAIRLADKPKNPCRVNFTEAVNLADDAAPLPPKVLGPVKRWFNATLSFSPSDLKKKMLGDVYRLMGG